ncbi:MAG: pantetheine-phosphate adenylyltransferase [Clostridia bacterium]|nr:pantetheine-phosphate adenylyltransferase [Clostridia bacterium]
MKKCVYTGTFDPPTLGHKSVVEDSLKIFDEVVVAVLCNPAKKTYFSLEDRLEMLRLTFGEEKRVKVISFDGTAAELLAKEGTDVYVRGVRNTIDFDYENADYFATYKLSPSATAVYLPCRQHLLHVSSSIVRNSLRFSTPIDEYVTKEVEEYIYKLEKLKKDR